MEIYRIVLADDHSITRHVLMEILKEDPSLKVIGDVGDGSELIHFLEGSSAKPNMVIMDISMPNRSGIEMTRSLKIHYPYLKVLILTMHRELEYIHASLDAGADGYLLKEDAEDKLFSAIRAIRQGSIYVSPLLRKEMAWFS